MEPPPLVSWDALLHFLQPCWLHKLSHSHPRPSPGLVITKLLLKDTPSSHSLATSSAFPVLSLPSSLGTVLSACSLGSLPRPQLITSTTLPGYLPTPLPPIPHTWGGGPANGLLPSPQGGRSNAHQTSLQCQGPRGWLLSKSHSAGPSLQERTRFLLPAPPPLPPPGDLTCCLRETVEAHKGDSSALARLPQAPPHLGILASSFWPLPM